MHTTAQFSQKYIYYLEIRNQFDMPENKEGRGIVGATFVVPALDEAEHILTLRDNIRVQRQNLSPHVFLRLVIADNGSEPETQRVYQQILSKGGKNS